MIDEMTWSQENLSWSRESWSHESWFWESWSQETKIASRLKGMGHCFLLPKCALGKLIVYGMIWQSWDIILCCGIGDTASCCSHSVVQAWVIARCSYAGAKISLSAYTVPKMTVNLVWPKPDQPDRLLRPWHSRDIHPPFLYWSSHKSHCASITLYCILIK